jgi:copper homeostasis protein CutC
VEQKIILRDIETIINLGYHGVVVGALTVNDQPDYPFLEMIAEQFAAHTWLTFHRAFDHISPSGQPAALIQLQQLGFKAVLTSGLPNTSAIQGAATIAALQSMVHHKKLDFQLIAGGGVHHSHVADLVRQTGVNAIHGAFLERPFTPDFRVDATEIRAVYEAIQSCN